MPGRRTYVIDTSVLLSDPYALLRFDEHEVVLPVVVITELEGKRHHPELGYFARGMLLVPWVMRMGSATRARSTGVPSTCTSTPRVSQSPVTMRLPAAARLPGPVTGRSPRGIV